MRKVIILLLFCWASQSVAQLTTYNDLLQKHVSNSGLVDYESFKKEEAKLATYIAYLQETSPKTSWSKNKQKAFWINAYNAYTIKLILESFILSKNH